MATETCCFHFGQSSLLFLAIRAPGDRNRSGLVFQAARRVIRCRSCVSMDRE